MKPYVEPQETLTLMREVTRLGKMSVGKEDERVAGLIAVLCTIASQQLSALATISVQLEEIYMSMPEGSDVDKIHRIMRRGREDER